MLKQFPFQLFRSHYREVMDSLFREVTLMETPQKFKCPWDLSLFHQDHTSRVIDLTEQQIQEDRAPLLTAVAEELTVQDTGGPLNYNPDTMNTGNFVIVKSSSSDPLKRPFWLCQIIQNRPGGDKLIVYRKNSLSNFKGDSILELLQGLKNCKSGIGFLQCVQRGERRAVSQNLYLTWDLHNLTQKK